METAKRATSNPAVHAKQIFLEERMSQKRRGQKTFGCESCWPTSADEAHKAISTISFCGSLVDESHFMVSLGCCPKCDQMFVKVFTETIDWKDGEDPQHRTCMPITKAEFEILSTFKDAGDSAVLHRTLEALAPDRPSLNVDWPKGQPQTRHWGTGIFILPYD